MTEELSLMTEEEEKVSVPVRILNNCIIDLKTSREILDDPKYIVSKSMMSVVIGRLRTIVNEHEFSKHG